MSDWTAGYVSDIGYTYGYYAELNPLRVQLAFLNAGVVPPEIGTACELGFGQGLSSNIHASTSQIKWYGTDFNPAQAGFAQELEKISGNGAKLYDESFEEFFSRSDLPEFDYIGLHGIWSWISDENRQAIVDFIKRKLKVGGVLYISYNTQPGWASMVPMRDLLVDYANLMVPAGHGITSRIDGAIDFTEKLIETKPLFALANPGVVERFKKMKDHNRNYLAHEYFNQDWLPMSFAKVAKWLAPTKLNYVCSAHYIDHVQAINLTGEHIALLSEVTDPVFRQTVLDFMVNQQFRKDYWIKGARNLTTLEQARELRKQRVILTQPASEVVLKVNGLVGEVELQAAIYEPILELLSDHKPKRLLDIENLLRHKGIALNQIVEAVIVLAGTGAVVSVQEDEKINACKTTSDKLNMALMNKSQSSNDLSYLGSPVIGGGIPVGRFMQLFLLAIISGKKLPEDWAQYAWEVLATQNQRLQKNGVTIESAEENIAELTEQANTFSQRQLPILKALQII